MASLKRRVATLAAGLDGDAAVGADRGRAGAAAGARGAAAATLAARARAGRSASGERKTSDRRGLQQQPPPRGDGLGDEGGFDGGDAPGPGDAMTSELMEVIQQLQAEVRHRAGGASCVRR